MKLLIPKEKLAYYLQTHIVQECNSANQSTPPRIKRRGKKVELTFI